MLSFDLGEAIAAGLVALISAVSAYFTGRMTAKTNEEANTQQAKTDETTIALSAWKELINPLQEELREAKQEISALREALEIAEARHQEERAELVKEIQKLRSQINKNKKDLQSEIKNA